jgi:tRNA U34 5-methylaminomethyl-2-thiouridine-forming methyltransferase MnmC
MSDFELSDQERFPRKVIITDDGSSSLYVEGMDETYHSKKGAIKESQFIFIEHGLNKISQNTIRILEVGMGTGLNVLLTILNADSKQIIYEALEPFPLRQKEWKLLNYCSQLNCPVKILEAIHISPVNTFYALNKHFILTKYIQTLQSIKLNGEYDLIYFDAFAPNKQASPWIMENLRKLYNHLKIDGILVTYCAQGQFKRNLKSIGFELENPPGPMGKWEITIAKKRA